MKTLDALDTRLIQLLGKNARQSSEALAKQLNVSSGTIRRRLRRLQSSGGLKFVAVVDPDDLGLSFAALIALDVEQLKINAAMQVLASRLEVRWIAMVTGRFDIIFFVRLPSGSELADFMDTVLGKIQGLKNSETFVCVRTEKIHHMRV